MSVYNLLVKIGGDAKQLIGSFKAASEAAGTYADAAGRMRDANGRFVASANSAGGAAGGLGLKLQDLIIGNLAADAIQKLTSAIASVPGAAIKMAGELEQNKIAFETMLGSAEKANSFLADLATFAANTPFELKGLQDSSKKLLAFGFDSQQIIPMMTAIGNAVGGLGGGAAEINRVTMALGQMQAKGKVSAEEMMQLAELGIPAWDMLAKSIGTDVPTAMDLASKGAIPAAAAIEGLVNGMNERFPNMMAKQSKTLLGSWSNLQDGISAVLVRLGTEFVDTFNVTGILQNTSEAVGSLVGVIDKLGVGGALATLFSPEVKAAIIGIATALTAYFAPAAYASASAFLTATIPAIGAAVVAAAPFIAAGAAVAGAAYLIMKNWDPIKGFFVGLWNNMLEGVKGFVDGFKSGFNFLGQIVSSVAAFIKDKLAFVLKFLPQGMQDAIKDAGNAVLKLPGLVIEPVKNAAVGVGNAAKGMVAAIADPARDGLLAVKGFFAEASSSVPAQAGNMAKQTGKALALGLGDAAKDAKKHAEKIAEIFRDLKVGEEMAKSFNTGADATKAQMQAIESAAKRLMDEGISPQDKRVKELVARYQELEKQLEASKVKTYDAGAAIDSMGAALEAAKTKAALLGSGFDLNEERGKILKDTLEKLAENGVKPSDDAMKQLTDTAKKLGIDLSTVGVKAEKTKGPLDNFKTTTTDILNSVKGLRDGLAKVGEAFGINVNDPVTNSIVAVGDFGLSLVQVAASGQTLLGFLQSLDLVTKAVTAAQWLWNIAMTANPIGIIIVGIGAAIAAIGLLAKNWGAVTGWMGEAWNNLMKFFGSAGEAIGGTLKAVFDGIVAAISGTFNFVLDMIKNVINALVIGPINLIIGGFNLIPGVKIPEIPYLAQGGIVTGPTTAVIGEGASEEAVLPLNDDTFARLGGAIAAALPQAGGSSVGGNQEIHLHFNELVFMQDEAAMDRLAELIGIRLNNLRMRAV